MSDQPVSMDDFLASFGASPATTAAEEEKPAENTPEPTTEPTPDTTPENTTPTPETTPASTAQQDSNVKMNQAFADMRVKNSAMEKTIKGLAALVGIQSNDPLELTQAIQTKLTEAQAKAQGVPPEILTRLQQLEEKDQLYTQQDYERNAYLGFQKIKDSFSLDDTALQSFCDELVAAGLNPFTQNINVEAEYKLRNYDKIVASAVERGIRQEAERAAKASKLSSAPDQSNGVPPAEQGRIDTIADLDSFLSRLPK